MALDEYGRLIDGRDFSQRSEAMKQAVTAAFGRAAKEGKLTALTPEAVEQLVPVIQEIVVETLKAANPVIANYRQFKW